MDEELKAFARAVRARDAAATRSAIEKSAHVRAHVNDPLFDFGQRAAHIVAREPAVLDVLLSFGADLNLRSDWENGPYTVLDNADAESARFLIARGATLTACAAARLGWFDELKAFVASDPLAVHERGGDGQQPLHQAATVAIADYLLDNGADIDARCMDHQSTPAQYALVERPDVCRRLLERGATPDIFMAARLGDRPLAQQLIEEHPACVAARVNLTGYPPVPPFNIYCWTLGFLVSPHVVALAHEHRDVYDLLIARSSGTVRLLDAVERGDEVAAHAMAAADPSLVEALTPADQGVLAQAIFHGRYVSADLMLRLGFDPSTPGVDGGTALHAACWVGHAPLVRRILADGRVPIDTVDATHGSTPLGWAAFGSTHRCAEGADYVAVIDELVGAGADVHLAGNRHGTSVVSMADGNAVVQAALRRHGAV